MGTDDVGPILKRWRSHRRMSQLDLASRATVSTRHLSCVETGRTRPSREVILHLAQELDVPLGQRNELLLAAEDTLRYWANWTANTQTWRQCGWSLNSSSKPTNLAQRLSSMVDGTFSP